MKASRPTLDGFEPTKETNVNRTERLSLVRDTGVIAIMRAQSSEQLIAAADAIRAGGVRGIEVTMTTPGALDVIPTARDLVTSPMKQASSLLLLSPSLPQFAARGTVRDLNKFRQKW